MGRLRTDKERLVMEYKELGLAMDHRLDNLRVLAVDVFLNHRLAF
jgi:hypothetical protein